MIPYKYSQLIGSVAFDEIVVKEDEYVPIDYHLGQLKLFFTELQFLSMWAHLAKKVLYVGAANGYHIGKLAELFPDLMFDLWDPGRFEVKETANIRIFNKFFDDAAAESYKSEGDQILFMCDIRTLKIALYKKNQENQKMDQLVVNDMLMQQRWVQMINPIYAFLKFRLPYYTEKVSYLTGTIYLQPYAPLSTETRLMTNNYIDEKIYNNFEFDAKMAYFNYITRQKRIEHTKWKKCLSEYNLVNAWDNVIALNISLMYVTRIKDNNSLSAACRLFMDVVNYHRKRYGKKYDILFKEKPGPLSDDGRGESESDNE